MDLRICAPAKIRKGGSMSRSPDLSAFPIPRKGGARPIAGDDTGATKGGAGQGGAPEASTPTSPPPVAAPERDDLVAASRISDPMKGTSGTPRAVQSAQQLPPPRALTPPSSTYGQMVATTVKLDENRYLRLMEAGKPGPGRLKRRTIQDMLIEALDEWFERRRI